MIHIKLCFFCKKETLINIYSSQRTSTFVKKLVYALYYFILSFWLHFKTCYKFNVLHCMEVHDDRVNG